MLSESSLPLTIIPDEINLTRRVLEPMHRFHKLAAGVMCIQAVTVSLLVHTLTKDRQFCQLIL